MKGMEVTVVSNGFNKVTGRLSGGTEWRLTMFSIN